MLASSWRRRARTDRSNFGCRVDGAGGASLRSNVVACGPRWTVSDESFAMAGDCADSRRPVAQFPTNTRVPVRHSTLHTVQGEAGFVPKTERIMLDNDDVADGDGLLARASAVGETRSSRATPTDARSYDD